MFLLLRPFLPYIAGVLAIFCIVFAVYHYGVTSERGKEAALAVKEVEIHAKIEKRIMALPDTDLDKRLSKWMRD